MIGIEAVMALMMQPAAFDTENVSTVADEVQHQRALPMLCQSLQSVASYLGFRWRDDLKSQFHYRVFDALNMERDEDEAHLVLTAPGSGARSRPITCTGPGVSTTWGRMTAIRTQSRGGAGRFTNGRPSTSFANSRSSGSRPCNS